MYPKPWWFSIPSMKWLGWKIYKCTFFPEVMLGEYSQILTVYVCWLIVGHSHM